MTASPRDDARNPSAETPSAGHRFRFDSPHAAAHLPPHVEFPGWASDAIARHQGCIPLASRRRFIITSGAVLFLAPLVTRMLPPASAADDENRLSPELLEQLQKRWDGERQIVLAYKQGPELGEPCRRLDAVKDELPVKLIWALPPEWVDVFPTIHFEKSNLKWEVARGWTSKEEFIRHYEQFNPPEKSPNSASPYRPFLRVFQGPKWSWPGRITDHLLDPHGPHQFSEYELRGLTVRQKKQLHTAHHQAMLEPGKRPPVWPSQES